MYHWILQRKGRLIRPFFIAKMCLTQDLQCLTQDSVFRVSYLLVMC